MILEGGSEQVQSMKVLGALKEFLTWKVGSQYEAMGLVDMGGREASTKDLALQLCEKF